MQVKYNSFYFIKKYITTSAYFSICFYILLSRYKLLVQVGFYFQKNLTKKLFYLIKTEKLK